MSGAEPTKEKWKRLLKEILNKGAEYINTPSHSCPAYN